MKKTVLIVSVVLFVVGCVIVPVKTASQTAPVKQKVVVKIPVTDSNSSTTVNSGPIIFSHEREDITYIWDSKTNCFYYMTDGKRVDMPQGWRH